MTEHRERGARNVDKQSPEKQTLTKMKSIRRARPEDIPALVDMMDSAHSEGGYLLNRELAEVAFSTLIGDSKQGLAWIANGETSPLGYLALTYKFSMESGGLHAYIEDLFVQIDARRRGISSDLIEEAMIHCRREGIYAIHVEAGSEDQRATNLYAKHGLMNRGHVLLSAELARNELATL